MNNTSSITELSTNPPISSAEAMKPWFDIVDTAWEEFIIDVENGKFGPDITLSTVDRLLNEAK